MAIKEDSSCPQLEPESEVDCLLAALRQRDLWLASITHDLRTPITVIHLHTLVLQRLLECMYADRPSLMAEGSGTQCTQAPAAGMAQTETGTVGTVGGHRDGRYRHWQRPAGRRHRVEQECRESQEQQAGQVAQHLPMEPLREQTEQTLEQVQACLAKLTAAVSRTVALVDEVADLTRSEAGYQLVLQRQPTDLVALAQQVAADYQVAPVDVPSPHHGPAPRLSTVRTCVRVVALSPQVTGYWDAVRLQRVLGNLLENAIKYSPDGGEILVEVGRTQAGPKGAWAVLRVRDRGLGIPEADLPTIFEPFRRGGNVAERIPGSGMGLASVRQIVEQHSGTIRVASEPEAGTKFTIRLPLCRRR
jgi:signal transduction histidine kinase